MGGKGSGPKPKNKRLTDRIEAALAGEEEVEIEEVVSAEEAETLDKYDRIRQKLGGATSGKVKILRWRPDGSLASLLSLPFDGFDEDVLGQRYGGGKYILKFYKGDELLGSDVVTIDDSIKPMAPAQTPMPSGGSGMSAEAAMLLGQMDGMKLLVQSQATMMQGLITAMSGGGNNRSGSDPLDIAVKIAEIMKGAGGGGVSPRELVTDMASTFREGLRFGQMVNSPPEKGLGDVIEALVPPVTKALEAAAAQGRSPAQPARAIAAPQPEQPMDLARAPWLIHLRPFFKEIATWAQNGWDARRYIGSMVARLPENVLDEIALASRDPQFIENALAALPQPFLAYRAWVTTALDELREEMKEEEGPAPVEEEEDEDEGGES